MKKIFLFLTVASLYAGDEPDWVTTPGRSIKYSSTAYVVGYGSASAKNENAIKIAEDNARAALSSSIVSNIKSDIVSKLEEDGKKAIEYFSSVTQSSTSLQLSGVATDVYKDKKTIHALAYVRRVDLLRIYSEKKTELTRQINALISQATADENAKRIEAAATKYLGLYPLLDELREAKCILRVADNSGVLAETLAEEGILSKEDIQSRIDKLLAQTIHTVDDAARAIAYQISKQVKTPIGKIIVSSLTYQDTKMSSSFARYFRQALEAQFQKFSIWEVAAPVRGMQPASSQVTRDLVQASGAQVLFEGNYWEQGDRIKIIGRLRDVGSSRILASSEIMLDATYLSVSNLQAKPENALKALAEQKVFAEGEVISSDIQLDVWTDKGNENLVYSEGEAMKIFVRVNRACHLRILYNFADGSRTLLYNDYFVDEAKENFTIEIPGEFECIAPFGAETMLVCARLDPFPTVKTYEQEGVLFLDEKDAKKAGISFRGFKKKDADPKSVKQTETRLIITTIAR